MFEKLDEYLINIYMSQEMDTDFNIFKMDSKKNYSIRGFLDSNNAYMLFRKNNQFGLKVNHSQYIFFYSREKFLNSKEFKTIIKNDSEYGKDQLIEKCKNIDTITIGEFNELAGNGQTLSFLVNKSSYLVTNYFRIYEDKSSVLASYNANLLNIEELAKLHVLNPVIPDFNITEQKKNNIVVIVADNFHENFNIKENMRDTCDLEFRKSVVQKMSNEAVESDRKSYTIIKDFDECAKRINESINQRFNNKSEER